MATVNISYDTVTKGVSVTVDGNVLNNVVYACVTKYSDDEAYISIEQEGPKQDGLKSYTRIYGSVDKRIAGDIAMGRATAISKDKTIVSITDDKVYQNAIAKLLGRN